MKAFLISAMSMIFCASSFAGNLSLVGKCAFGGDKNSIVAGHPFVYVFRDPKDKSLRVVHSLAIWNETLNSHVMQIGDLVPVKANLKVQNLLEWNDEDVKDTGSVVKNALHLGQSYPVNEITILSGMTTSHLSDDVYPRCFFHERL